MSKPRFGLHWVNAFFLMGFGGALVWSNLPTSAASQLYRLGLTPAGLGYALILAGALMILIDKHKWNIALTFSLMPYTVASLLLFIERSTAQSLMVYLFIQVAMVIVAQANEILRGET